MPAINKPLSIAVDELSKGLIKILPGDAAEELEIAEMQETDEASADVQDGAAEETETPASEESAEEEPAEEQ